MAKTKPRAAASKRRSVAHGKAVVSARGKYLGHYG